MYVEPLGVPSIPTNPVYTVIALPATAGVNVNTPDSELYANPPSPAAVPSEPTDKAAKVTEPVGDHFDLELSYV